MRNRGFRQAGGLLHKSVRKATENRGFTETRLLTDWESICGTRLAKLARPVRISYAQAGLRATLQIECSGAIAPEVSLQKEEIRERVNACYGYNAIQKITIRQTSTAPAIGFAEEPVAYEPRPVKRRSLQGFEDQSLKEALETLAENIETHNSPLKLKAK